MSRPFPVSRPLGQAFASLPHSHTMRPHTPKAPHPTGSGWGAFLRAVRLR